ncbi:hypothetical protein KAT63_04305 [Candidatus Parcubacteria bacterium]|nr:hypothetical protein [Candidatus Parcubacteria bacterium]
MYNKIIKLEFELEFSSVWMMLKRLGIDLNDQGEVNRAIERYLSEILKNQIRLAKENEFSIKVTDKTTSFN